MEGTCGVHGRKNDHLGVSRNRLGVTMPSRPNNINYKVSGRALTMRLCSENIGLLARFRFQVVSDGH